mgnify:CR=1 FL=1
MTHNRIRFRVAACISLGLALVAGCQGESEITPTERQARLLAAQNVDLKQRVLELENGMQTLRGQWEEKLERKEEELAGCRAQNELLKEDLETGIAERVSGVTAAVMEENARLRRQIEDLKAVIDENRN